MAPSPNGISLHVTVWIAPENEDAFLAAFRPLFGKVAAEPECRFFEMFTSPEEPGRISWVEDWSKSREWFIENQISKDYYKEYFAITEPMFLKPREFKFLERTGPEYFMAKERQFGN